MAARALVVGIDAYSFQPLTSAVNDARAFANTLLELGLVTQAELTLLTAPGTGATFDQVHKVLREVYRSGNQLDRFYFYFAGHGLLAYADAAKTQARTALVAQDVDALEDDGRKLIDFDELRDKLQLTGPKEQFYFIDACRDLGYEKHPDLGTLGFSGVQAGAARAQLSLFAVSPLGKALGSREGMGVMTRHLVAALRGEGVATEYDPANDRFVVTMQSVHVHVREQVRQTLSQEPMWRLKYMEPELVVRGPQPSPVRTLDTVPDVPLTIHIDPDAAASGTRVELGLRRMPLHHMCLPPRANHETLLLAPQHYSIKVESTVGTPEPTRLTVDVRTTRELNVRVTPAGMGIPAPVPPQASTLPPAPAVVAQRVGGGILESLGSPREKGSIFAQTVEPAAVIRVAGLEPPYSVHEARGRLDVTLPTGPYRVTFRLGTDVFGVRDVYVLSGEAVEVRPNALQSSIIRDVLGTEAPAETVTPSESIGPMQAAVLSTLLPIIGLKAFDAGNTFFRRGQGLVPQLDSSAFNHRPVIAVIALEGAWRNTGGAFRRMQARVHDGFDGQDRGSAAYVSPLHRAPLLPDFPPGMGFDRIGLLTLQAPGPSFILGLDSPDMGAFKIAVASIKRRVTVIGLMVRPDGSFDLSQNLLRIPGESYPEPHPLIPHARLVRELQLGQKLYAAGELREALQNVPDLRALLSAKWTDPILGCMAYLAGRNEPRLELINSIAARNLGNYFTELPDAHIIHALHEGRFDPQAWELRGRQRRIPVLAESLRELVRLGADATPFLAELEEVARRIMPGQPWTCVWRS
jgi:hypothetical protein